MNIRVLTLLAALGLGAAQPAFAQEAQATDENFEVFRDTDASLTCLQIADEASQLSEQMGGTPNGGVFGSLGGVARSGAAMLIPGAGLAMAGADVLTRPQRERREARALAIQHRWYYLNGRYAGQRCEPPPVTAAAATPAPDVAATPPPAVTTSPAPPAEPPH